MDQSTYHSVEWLQGRWQRLSALGVVLIIVGIAAIAAAFTATLASVFFIGCLLLAAGIIQFIEALSTQGWAGFFGRILSAILYGVVGWYMMSHPAMSALPLTLLIGVLLVAGGLYQAISAAVIHHRSWGWSFFQGVVGFALGILIFSQWPASSLWVVGLFVGVDLIFRGWSTFMLSMGLHAVQQSAAGRVPQFQERRMGQPDRRTAIAA